MPWRWRSPYSCYGGRRIGKGPVWVVEVSQDQALEALGDGGAEGDRAEVITARCSGVLWQWHDGGGFKAHPTFGTF